MSRARSIYGFHAVLSKLRHDPEAIVEIYLDAERKDARARDLIRHAEGAGVKLMSVEGKRLESMAPGARHQGEGTRGVRDIGSYDRSQGRECEEGSAPGDGIHHPGQERRQAKDQIDAVIVGHGGRIRNRLIDET